jgi:uncharacterized membrane protein
MTDGLPHWRHRRHSPFYAASIAGLLTLPVFWILARHLAVEISAIVFFLVYLGMMARRIPRLTVGRLKTSAERDNAPAYVILIVTLLAVITVIATLFNALNRSANPSAFEVAIAFLSVIAGWLTIHTMFAMHYAHHYWRRVSKADGTLGTQCGLEFPQTPEPCGHDFLYFSLVIGMTAQTSDVVITTTAMRRINLGHAVLSFFFNTVLVAAAVNAVVSLAG